MYTYTSTKSSFKCGTGVEMAYNFLLLLKLTMPTRCFMNSFPAWILSWKTSPIIEKMGKKN